MLLALAAGQARAAEPRVPERPRVRAVRVERAPALDGRVDEPVWAGVPASEGFVQKFPRERQAPAERTRLRVAYDDDALYVAIECEQRLAPVVRRLTRRDRMVETDWVSVAIDSRRDGKSAFEFAVSAAGVLTDSLRYDDTALSLEWDENWEAHAAVDSDRWSAELRIPLRILRFASLPVQSWGLQVRRYVSHRQETDEWAFIPRSSAGEVSHYGRLEDLRDLRPARSLEVSPFVWGRYRQDAQLDGGQDYGAAAGLDLKWHPSQRLTLAAAVLPDFAQVEADQLVLNLTTFETLYPEKRRLFLEGYDSLVTSDLQLLYTRRIGRPLSPPALRAGESLAGLPEPAPIYGAAKLTGQLADGWDVGALSALTAPNRIDVLRPDGTRERRTVDPLTAYQVVRVRRGLGGNGYLGVTATSVVRGEPGTLPPGAEPAPPTCPDGREATAQGRCSNNAHVAAVDWRWRSPSGDYLTWGQVTASWLQGGPPRLIPDGTVIRDGDVGSSTRLVVAKEGGHWLGDAWFARDSAKLEVNDLGYLDRANLTGVGGKLGYRTLHPWAGTLETVTNLEGVVLYDERGLLVWRPLDLTSEIKLASFWKVKAGLGWHGGYFEDREVGDGTALEHPGRAVATLRLESDRRAPVAAYLTGGASRWSGGRSYELEVGVLLHLLPQLDLELIPRLLHTRGEVRYAATADTGEHLFGPLDARSADATLRATYTFTPRLTLQTYAQLFLASTHYPILVAAAPASGGAPAVVHLRDLPPPLADPPLNADRREGALNANLVLRWEFRTGCLLYLVYTRAQVPTLPLGPDERGRLDLGAVRRAPASNVLLAKLAYWWG